MSEEWLQIHGTFELPTDDIKDVEGLINEDGDIYIRITRNHPYIDILCKDYTEAKKAFKTLTKSMKVVNIQNYKEGK